METGMKNIPRLILVFSAGFIVIFLLFLAYRYLHNRIELIESIPVIAGTQIKELAAVAQTVVPITIYLAMLAGLSYSARRGIPVHVSIICLLLLGMSCTLLVSGGLYLLKNSRSVVGLDKTLALGKSGLILSQSDRVVVLLHDPGYPQGAQVISRTDQPLLYQEQSVDSAIDVVPVDTYRSFSIASRNSNEAYFLNNLFLDFSFIVGEFNNRQREGIFSFILYIFSLMFLLSSLRFIMDISAWPIANVFLGIMSFRGIAMLERFLDSQATQHLFISFLGERFPRFLISPLLFCTMGILLILFTILIYSIKSRTRTYEN